MHAPCACQHAVVTLIHTHTHTHMYTCTHTTLNVFFRMLAGRIAELEHRLKVLEISGLLPQRVTTEGGVEQLQVWKADQEEEDGGRHEHCEQDNLSLSGATGTKLATESASHVEVA